MKIGKEIKRSTKLFGTARSSYYEKRKRKESSREKEIRDLKREIMLIWEESKKKVWKFENKGRIVQKGKKSKFEKNTKINERNRNNKYNIEV